MDTVDPCLCTQLLDQLEPAVVVVLVVVGHIHNGNFRKRFPRPCYGEVAHVDVSNHHIDVCIGNRCGRQART